MRWCLMQEEDGRRAGQGARGLGEEEKKEGGGHGVTLGTGERELGDAESGRKKNSDEKSADDKKHAKTAKAAARALPPLALSLIHT